MSHLTVREHPLICTFVYTFFRTGQRARMKTKEKESGRGRRRGLRVRLRLGRRLRLRSPEQSKHYPFDIRHLLYAPTPNNPGATKIQRGQTAPVIAAEIAPRVPTPAPSAIQTLASFFSFTTSPPSLVATSVELSPHFLSSMTKLITTHQSIINAINS